MPFAVEQKACLQKRKSYNKCRSKNDILDSNIYTFPPLTEKDYARVDEELGNYRDTNKVEKYR